MRKVRSADLESDRFGAGPRFPVRRLQVARYSRLPLHERPFWKIAHVNGGNFMIEFLKVLLCAGGYAASVKAGFGHVSDSRLAAFDTVSSEVLIGLWTQLKVTV
jgi:hypothetical protein